MFVLVAPDVSYMVIPNCRTITRLIIIIWLEGPPGNFPVSGGPVSQWFWCFKVKVRVRNMVKTTAI